MSLPKKEKTVKRKKIPQDTESQIRKKKMKAFHKARKRADLGWALSLEGSPSRVSLLEKEFAGLEEKPALANTFYL
ncbi:MAG: hypothetical protein R3351_05800 [Nitrospirales bacterium]|nr:hypothetical protein [Nitrospirales bacterium]